MAASLVCRRFRPGAEADREFWAGFQIIALADFHKLCIERQNARAEWIRFLAESPERDFRIGLALAESETCAGQGVLESSPPTPQDGQIVTLEPSSEHHHTEIVVSSHNRHILSESPLNRITRERS